MSVNFLPPMAAASEAQYLAMLQNNAYPFPIMPAGSYLLHNQGPPPAQAISLFNGPFYSYSSDMIHPSQKYGLGPGDTPATAESGESQAHMNYGPNFALHPQNLGPMKPQKLHQFAASFVPSNVPGIDLAENQDIFQSFPEATRQNLWMMDAGQKSTNFRISGGKKSRVCDVSADDAERKKLSTKAQQSIIALMGSGSANISDVVTESSGRSLTALLGGVQSTSVPPTNNVSSKGHLQQQHNQPRHQMGINRGKTHASGSRPVLSEHLNSLSVMVGNFPNVLSNFPQNLVQSNSSPAQSPQRNHSSKTPISQAQFPLGHSNTNQYPQSLTNSSVSKGASGSSRTTSLTYANAKTGQSSIFSAQLPKYLPSKPSPNSQSILGNPNAMTPMQPQLFFSNPYSQVQSPHSTGTSSGPSLPNRFYMMQTRPDQHLLPVVLANRTATNDPCKVTAAATGDVKGGGSNHTAQYGAPSGGTLLSADFPCVHPEPRVVQLKPAEQK